MDSRQDITKLRDTIVDDVLRILRDQRDNAQVQDLFNTYIVDTQIFNDGPHYVTEKIAFNTPFRTRPAITFGYIIDQVLSRFSSDSPVATGYTPPLILPYVFAFTHDTGSVDGFFMGLYAITPIPASSQTYAISWYAKGKGSLYPAQRIDEAWTSAYDNNTADYLINDTGINNS